MEQGSLWLINKTMELCLLSVSFHGKEVRSSPKRRSDGRLSRTSSTEKEPCGEGEKKKEAEENKENMRLDEYYNDPDSWNESVISGQSDALSFTLFFQSKGSSCVKSHLK